MVNAIRAELLKARSGYWMLCVLAMAVLLPLDAWLVTRSELNTDGMDAETATKTLLGLVGLCPIAAAYVGGYVVTRDYYYRSIRRISLVQRKPETYMAKLTAGAARGLAAGVVGVCTWGGLTSVILWRDGTGFSQDAGMLVGLAGCLLACALGGVFGAAIGWALTNYHLVAAVTVGVPLEVDLPLMRVAPGVAKVLPNSALRFPDGVNVEVVRLLGPRDVEVRVYERGFAETWSCGTGVVASAVAAARAQGEDSGEWAIQVAGGSLMVVLDATTTYLRGPAVIIANGDLPRWPSSERRQRGPVSCVVAGGDSEDMVVSARASGDSAMS
ncbi:hypothetical protein [Amycolatopsis sp. NPDC004169]|uniref:hypothetical protein n=1 Tax=Amycolatopsis sp. NPDC004169 TaxID=3154453 RepID=UPI0033A16285